MAQFDVVDRRSPDFEEARTPVDRLRSASLCGPARVAGVKKKLILRRYKSVRAAVDVVRRRKQPAGLGQRVSRSSNSIILGGRRPATEESDSSAAPPRSPSSSQYGCSVGEPMTRHYRATHLDTFSCCSCVCGQVGPENSKPLPNNQRIALKPVNGARFLSKILV